VTLAFELTSTVTFVVVCLLFGRSVVSVVSDDRNADVVGALVVVGPV